MKTLAFVAVACLLAASASAFELGAGLAYDSQTEESSPYIGSYTDLAPGKTMQASWTRFDDTNLVTAGLALDVPMLDDFPLMLCADLGAGTSWANWDSWTPVLVYGAHLEGDVAAFTGRLRWQRILLGGEPESSNVFDLGLYVSK